MSQATPSPSSQSFSHDWREREREEREERASFLRPICYITVREGQRKPPPPAAIRFPPPRPHPLLTGGDGDRAGLPGKLEWPKRHPKPLKTFCVFRKKKSKHFLFFFKSQTWPPFVEERGSLDRTRHLWQRCLQGAQEYVSKSHHS